MANYYGSMAEIHRSEGRLDEEIAAYRKTLSVIDGRGFHDLTAGTKINLASALRYKREFEEAQRLLNEAEALCDKHQFKDFLSAIGRNRSDMDKELQASQTPPHTLAELLGSLDMLLSYRPDLGAAYLAFWYYTFNTQLLALLRSGPGLSLIVATNDVETFLNFAERFRDLASHFLMVTSSGPLIDVEPSYLPIPPDWWFPATFTFVGVRREGGNERPSAQDGEEDRMESAPRIRMVGPATMMPTYTYVGSENGEGRIMALATPRLPQEAMDLMLGRPVSELLDRRAMWIPIDRASSKDVLLTDLRIAHERGFIPVYLDQMPTSEKVTVCGGVRVTVPNAISISTRTDGERWGRELMRLARLPKEEAQRALLGLPDTFESATEPSIPIDVYLLEFSEIGRRVLQPVLLIQGFSPSKPRRQRRRRK